MRRTQQVQYSSMTNPTIQRLRVSGFLSFSELELELGRVNVLIGSNGSGKSNLLRLFEMLRAITLDSLLEFVANHGGANALLHYGRKHTHAIEIEVEFVDLNTDLRNSYFCKLIPTAHDELKITTERVAFHDPNHPKPYTHDFHSRGFSSILVQPAETFRNSTLRGIVYHVRRCLMSYRVYHFHDTSPESPAKQSSRLADNITLHANGSNLAPLLYRMREESPAHYRSIVERVQQAAPFFGDFVLEPHPSVTLQLRWRERGRDTVFSPDALSDGTLRYICLMTLLHQPPEWMPAAILIDEPELGLHPYAIKLLAGSLRMAAAHTQILVATQSPLLLDHFAPDEVLVAERCEHGATIRRLDTESLQNWLEDYSMGEIWEKNLIGGRPPR